MTQMDLTTKFWDINKSEVMTRYVCPRFMGHATADVLKDQFLDAMEGLDVDRCEQIAMDGPNVNKSFFNKMQDYRRSHELKELTDIGTCNLHNVHLAFKTGAKKSKDWEIKELLSAAYYLFHDSAARSEDYISKSGCSKFLSKI